MGDDAIETETQHVEIEGESAEGIPPLEEWEEPTPKLNWQIALPLLVWPPQTMRKRNTDSEQALTMQFNAYILTLLIPQQHLLQSMQS